MGDQPGPSGYQSKRIKLTDSTFTDCPNVNITQEVSAHLLDNPHLGENNRPGPSRNVSSPIVNYQSSFDVRGNNFNYCNNINFVQGGASQVNPVPRLMYDLPEEMPLEVVGRDCDVDVIYNLLRNDGRQRVSITGLGGIGKTTLAMYCATRWSNAGANVSASSDQPQQQEFHSVAFIHSGTAEAFEKSIQGLAAKLRIPDKQALREISKDVADMYINKDFLYILDNVERCADVQVLIEVQKSQKNVFILATSQNIEMDAHFNIHAINMLTREDTVQLFKSILGQGRRISERYVGELHELLGGLPLAVSHATSWIRDEYDHDEDREYTSCDEHAVVYINKYEEMLAEPFPDQFQTINQKTAFITIKINIEKIKSDSQIFLNYLSHLNPDYIKIDIFKTIFSKLKLKTVVRDLVKYSLITVDGEYYRIHRLVQEVGRSLYQGKTAQLVTLYIVLQTEFNYYISHRNHFFKYVSKNKLLDMLDEAPMESVMAVYRRVVASALESEEEYSRIRCYMDVHKWPPLHLVAGTGLYHNIFNWTIDVIMPHVVRRLVDAGESVNGGMEDGLTPLHVACMVGHSACVEVLVGYNADVHATDTLGNTALHIAAECNSRFVIDKIINAGAEVNRRNHAGDTPLHLAASACYQEVYTLHLISELIKRGADVSIKNDQDETPYNVADNYGDPQTAQLLLTHEAMHERSDTVLHVAARTLDVGLVFNFGPNDCDVNCRNHAGDTPLHLAAAAPYHKGNTPRTIHTFIKCGADISMKNDQDETPYNVAVNHGDPRTAQLLLLYDLMHERGDTRLHVAARTLDVSLVFNFVPNDCDVNCRNHAGDTPLHLAAAAPYHENDTPCTIHTIIRCGADISIKNNQDEMPYNVAVNHGDPRTAQLLLLYDLMHERGDTMLHVAARTLGSEAVFQFRNDVNCRNSTGDTPLHLAAAVPYHEDNTPEVIHTLIRCGADISIKNNHNETPYNVAVNHGDPQTAQLLLLYDLMHERGDTLLHVAARTPDVSLVFNFGPNDCDVNCRNHAGDTPLHLVAAAPYHVNDTPVTIRGLIQLGADVSIKNNQDETPYMVAVNHGDPRTAQLMSKAQNRYNLK